MTKKLYHGAAYYPELWPESFVDRDIAEMRRLGINVVRVAEFAWSRMEPDEGRISLEFFVRVMDRLHAAGIGVVFCTPTPTPPIWLVDGHPERCFVDADGNVMSHGARQHASYEHPDVRAACMRIVEACAREVGRHPALIAWQIDNELKCHVAEDYSAAAVAHWHRWLEARYRTIEALNDAWGTEIWSERYQRFDQVPAPRKAPFLHSASLSTAYRLFSRDSIAEFLGAQCAILRQHSSAPITHNMSSGFSVSLEQLCAHLDFAAFDMYPRSKDWTAVVFNNDLFRAARPERPHWVMETSVSYNGWLGNHQPAHPPGFLVAEAVASYALGSEAFCYWLWRQQRTGCELPHSAVMSAWYKPSIGYREVQRVEKARQALEPLLTSTRPAPAEVAITWSDRGHAMILTEPLGANREHHVDFHAAIGEWHRVVMNVGYARDLRFEGAPLDGLKLLITPMMPAVSAEFRAKVEQFVRSGGVWLCAPVTGTRTEEHTVPTDAGLNGVESLAGIETVYSYPTTGTDAVAEAFGLSVPLAGWCSALRPTGPNTRVVGRLKTSLIGDEPLAVVTETALGRGAIVVLGAMPDGPEAAGFLEKLVAYCGERAGIRVAARSTPGTIACARVADDGRRSWIAVNLDGAGGEVSVDGTAVKLGAYEWKVI